jgi:hypothetical protein
MHNRDRWPKSWTTGPHGIEFRPDCAQKDEIIEVPLGVGDLLVFDNHLPHGTVRNLSNHPRAVFYVQMYPAGTSQEAGANVADHNAGIASPWWRWKPGHDRVEPGPPSRMVLKVVTQVPWCHSMKTETHLFGITNDAAIESSLHLARRLCLTDTEGPVNPQQHSQILQNL